jgi:hypothetical protein
MLVADTCQVVQLQQRAIAVVVAAWIFAVRAILAPQAAILKNKLVCNPGSTHAVAVHMWRDDAVLKPAYLGIHGIQGKRPQQIARKTSIPRRSCNVPVGVMCLGAKQPPV